MKVICIDAKPVSEPNYNKDFKIKEGVIYKVIGTNIFEDIEWYELEIDPGYYYPARRFVPVSDIDEKEFERNYNKRHETV